MIVPKERTHPGAPGGTQPGTARRVAGRWRRGARTLATCHCQLVRNCLLQSGSRAQTQVVVTHEQIADLAIVGHVVTSTEHYLRGEVQIYNGKIINVSPVPTGDAVERRLDVGTAYVMPGVIDPHVHCLSHASEGIETGTRSAAAGGVTTILEMPFDADGPIWSVAAFEAKRRRVEAEAHIDVAMYATVEPGGEGIKEIAGLAGAGAACFKVSTFHTDPRRFPRTPDDELLRVFSEIAKTGRRVCVHSENNEIVQAKVTELQRSGEISPLLHCASRPPVTETAAVANVLELGREIGVRLHFCHISTPRAIELVRWYASQGSPASAEVCPHYLTLTEDDMERAGARLKCNPPLRTREHVDGLWEQLRRGEIDAIASDHAPWPMELKSKANIFDNVSGGPGVETLLPIVASSALHERNVDVNELVRVTSTRVAETFGLADKKGDLKPGLDGDVVVFDADEQWTVDESLLQSNAGWSPFHGTTLRGRVMLTVSRGQIAYDGDKVQSQPGQGRFLRPA